MLGHAFLPVLAVKRLHGDRHHRAIVKAMRHDTDAVGIGPRPVKALHSARFAEHVASFVGVECVRRQRVFALEMSTKAG